MKETRRECQSGTTSSPFHLKKAPPIPQGPHSDIFNDGGGGGPKDFFWARHFGQKGFFWVYERRRDFFGSREQHRDFFGGIVFFISSNQK